MRNIRIRAHIGGHRASWMPISRLAWISTEKSPANVGLTQGIHLTRYFGADSTKGDSTNIGIAKGFIRLRYFLLPVSQYGVLIDSPARRHVPTWTLVYGQIDAVRGKERARNPVIRTP